MAVRSDAPLGSDPWCVMFGRQRGFVEAASVDAGALSDRVELASYCTFQGPRGARWQRLSSRRGRLRRGGGSTCRGPRTWAPQHGAAELSAGAPQGPSVPLICRDGGSISDAGTQIPDYLCLCWFSHRFTPTLLLCFYLYYLFSTNHF